MSDKCDQFGRVPYAVADAGRFAGLSGAEAVVYIVLAAHADGAWAACPGTTRIAELAGVEGRTARRALAELKRRGLIVPVMAGGGRGHRAGFRLVTNPGDVAPLSTEETRAISSRKPGQSTPETRAISSRNPGSFAPRNREGHTEQRSKQTGEQLAQAEAAVGNRDGNGSRAAGAADALQALKEAGIGPAKAVRLAALPGLTPDVVRHLARRSATGHNPQGLLVTLLENPDEVAAAAEGIRQERARLEAESRATASATGHARQVRSGDDENRQRLAKEQAARNALLASLTADEMKVYRARAIAEAPVWQQRGWRDADVRTHRMLRAAIAKLIRRDRAAGGPPANPSPTPVPDGRDREGSRA